MSESENTQPSTERVETPTEETTASTVETGKKHTTPVIGYVVALVVVTSIILGALFFLEKEGRSSTTLFSSIIEKQQNNKVVAIVNDEEIISEKLNTSIRQFSQMAASQGVDTSDPEALAGIREQALDVIVNTTLLKQAATEKGIVVTDEEVEERINTIRTDLGGEEELAERMAVVGISSDQLVTDIKDELLIQQLLDILFSEADFSITEDEVIAVYESAGGEEAGLPALEEVRGEVEAQIIASKEQVVIDEYLAALREEATIEIIEG